MVSMPNSQFVMRWLPDYCSAHPGRFACVLDPAAEEEAAVAGDIDAEAEPLMFVTFDASLLRHEQAGEVADAEEPVLRVSGHEAPFTYEQLCAQLGLSGRGQEPAASAFSRKVLTYLFRDINSGGCPDNWELLSYVSVDASHFSDVFDEAPELYTTVFLHTFQRAVSFLRQSFKGRGVPGSETYMELPLVDAFRATVAAHLTDYTLEFAERDVVGRRGAHYTQRYHYARTSDGQSNGQGQGSFRCLVTKARLRWQTKS
eukprot:5521506-Prymnesium_polylepis.2